jgi:hypothetical protein
VPAPVLKSFAQSVYDGLYPFQADDANNGYSLATFITALGEMFQVVEDYSRDQVISGKLAPGWSQLVDINRAPVAALPWLGQFVGVTLPDNLTEASQRQQIQQVNGWGRGTKAAILAAPAPYLTGTKTVILRERFGDAYTYQVLTKYSETPVADWPATNLMPNGGAEVDTSGYSATNGTVTRVTNDSKFGVACLEYNATGVSGGINANSPAPVSGTPIAVLTYTVSTYIKALGSTIGKTLHLQMNCNGGAFANAGIAVSDTVMDGTWQLVKCTGTVDHADRTGLIWFAAITGGVSGDRYRMDGSQLEVNTQATPYIDTNGAIASRPVGQGPVGAALRAQKPAGLIMLYNIISGNDYQLLVNNHALYSNVFADYATYQGVLNDAPGT